MEGETILVWFTLEADPRVKDVSASGLFRGQCQKTTRGRVGKRDSQETGAHEERVDEQITIVDNLAQPKRRLGASLELPWELLTVVNGNKEGGPVNGRSAPRPTPWFFQPTLSDRSSQRTFPGEKVPQEAIGLASTET